MGCFIFGGGGIGGNGGVPFDQVTMEPQFGLAGKKFIDKNKQLRTGTIQNWDGTPISLSEGDTPIDPDTINPSLTSKYIPAGVYLGKPVYFPKMPEGSVEVGLNGSTSFRVEKTAGYISGGTEDIALPPGKVVADDTYSGPYTINPQQAYYEGGQRGKQTLQTANKMCSDNIVIRGLYRNGISEEQAYSSTVFYLDYIYMQNYEAPDVPPQMFAMMAENPASGYISSLCGYCDTSGPYSDWIGDAYIWGSGYTDIVYSVQDEHNNHRIKITIDTSYVAAYFKTSVKFFGKLMG